MLDALRTELLLVGNHTGQFVTSSVFTVNPSNDPHRFTATEGKLQHAVYKGSTEGVWLLGGVGLTLESDAPYYLYARCSRTSNNGFYVASTDRIEVEAVEGWYHFPVGVVSSPFEGARVFNTTHGFTQLAGGTITTGKLQDAARRLVIDLDNGTITGPVTFKNDDHFETLADGGLLLTSLIKMTTDGVETGGLAANQNNILLWGGGTYDQAKGNAANTILRHDGSGQLARGKIQWGNNGDLRIGRGAQIGDFYVGDRVIDSWSANVLELDKTSGATLRPIPDANRRTALRRPRSLRPKPPGIHRVRRVARRQRPHPRRAGKTRNNRNGRSGRIGCYVVMSIAKRTVLNFIEDRLKTSQIILSSSESEPAPDETTER